MSADLIGHSRPHPAMAAWGQGARQPAVGLRRLAPKDMDQATKELQAADARGVGLKWYFAEQGAAEMARERFDKEGLDRIVVGYMPPRKSR